MRRNFIVAASRIMSDGAPAPEAEDVDRPGARPDLAQTVTDGVGGDLARQTRGLERLRAARELRGERGGMRAPRPVGGSAAVKLALDPHEAVAVEEDVCTVAAVTTGDDDERRAEGVELAGQLLGGAVTDQRACLGDVGRDHGRASHEPP